MSRKVMLSFCAVALFAVSAWAQTADELIDKHIKALGGLEKLKAVNSVKLTGKMKMGPMEAPLTVAKKRPGSFRVDFTIQGMTGTQAYDGSTGWMIMPFLGKKEAEKMPEDMLKEFRDEADFDGPFVDYKAKGNKVEFIGKEDVQGTPAYKLHLTMKDGNEQTLFLDADSYLLIKSEAKHKVQGQEIEGESTFGDYKEVGGLMFPFTIENKMKGKEGSQTFVFDKVDLNASLDSASFAMPAAAPAVKAEETKKQQ